MPKAKPSETRELTPCAIAHIKSGANLALESKILENQGVDVTGLNRCMAHLFKTGHEFGVDEGFDDADISEEFGAATNIVGGGK